MKDEDATLLRNIGIAAHIDAGKTTLTERILFYAGRTHRMGEVHDGTTVMDYMEEERERGITIMAAATQAQWNYKDHHYTINIIDTPGHVDFTVEVERSLRVCDGLIALLSAVEGVEPQSETVWRQADRYHIPRLVFVNKMDLPGADFEDVIQQIRKRFAVRTLALQAPIGQEEYFQGVVDLVTQKALVWDGEDWQVEPVPDDMWEEVAEARQHMLITLAEFDETMFVNVFEAPEEITEEMVRTAIRKATIARQVVPIFCGSAYKNRAVQPLLDAICDYLPSPADMGATNGLIPATGEGATRSLRASEPFAALVFKVVHDEQHHKIVFFRVYSGLARRGQTVFNPRTQNRERLNNIYQLHGGKHNAVWEVSAGDIAALGGIKDIVTGDTICDPDHPIILETIPFPEPVIAMVVEARHSRDLDKLKDALRLLEEEDPSFKAGEDPETGQMLIHGMGELHLEVMSHRLRDEHRVEVNMGRPQVNYKEQFSQTVSFTHEYTRAVGEPLYAQLEFELGPADSAFLESLEFQTGRQRVQFEESIPEGSIKPDYLPAVRHGFESMWHVGPLAGLEMHSFKVRVTGGKMSAESNALAFELCAREAFRAAAPQCSSIMVEPIMSVEVTCPDEYTGGIMGDLNRRRGIPLGLDVKSTHTIIRAHVPLSELFGYANQVRNLSSGRALASITFSHYAPAPEAVVKIVLEHRKGYW
ncbi:MAG: elongation factor G [Saprospirales bacterium]|nr:elongation factor G [Saprospirales bacterium]